MTAEAEELAAAAEVLFQTARGEIDRGSGSHCLEVTQNEIFTADN